MLFHLALGQAVLHPGLIERVDFFPSAAPARYGGVAGGIVAGATRAPAHAFHGEANLRLVDAGALLEAPFPDNRGSAMIAGRYGYPGPIIELTNEDVLIDYWDYQARATWNLDNQNALGIFAFGSHDYLGNRSPSQDPRAAGKVKEQLVSDFHRIDLRYDRALRDGQLRFAVTGGYDSMGAETSFVSNYSAAARLELEHKLTTNSRYRGGVDGRVDHYRLRLLAQDPAEPQIPYTADPPPSNVSVGLHSDFVWRVAPRVELVPGVRVGVFASQRRRPSPGTGYERVILPAVDPRLASRVSITAGVAWLSTLGVSHQYPSLRLGNVPAPLVSIPGFPLGVRKLQRAAQLGEGLELALPADLVLTTTGFFNYWWGLTDLSASCYQFIAGQIPQVMPGQSPPYVCPDNDPTRPRLWGRAVTTPPFQQALERLALVHAVAHRSKVALHHPGWPRGGGHRPE